VPLRILALGRDAGQLVQADVFLLTDRRPQLLSGDSGLQLARSEAASSQLLDDLRSDKGMDWVPDRGWLTYLKVDTPAGLLTHDLAASVNPFEGPSRIDAGITSDNKFLSTLAEGSHQSWRWPTAIAATVAISMTLFQLGRSRRRVWAR
jgi:hypothetical protein